jgi:N-acetylmuramoyl-L-alanine amidase
VKFLILWNALKRILSRLMKELQSEPSSTTSPSLKHAELVAICVGHSRKGDKGAVNVKGDSEWRYNSKVAKALKKELTKREIKSKVYSSYEGSNYREAMTFVKDKLKEDGVDLALELHFNAYTGRAKGCSMLYRSSKEESKKLAEELQFSVLKNFSTIDRKTKGLKEGDRGLLFVNNDELPSVLCEPFFGDNRQDCELFSDFRKLAFSYAAAIENFLVGKVNK